MANRYTHVPRAVPMRLAIPIAARRGRRAWDDHRAWAKARTAMDRITGGELDAGRLDDVTRRHLVEREIRREFFWRIRPFRKAVLDETRSLTDAVAAGRGVIVSHCHHGVHHGLPQILAGLGIRVHIVPGGSHFKHRDTRQGRRHQRQQHRLAAPGSLVAAKGSFDALGDLLEQGEVVGIAFDIAGRTPTRFLGQDLRLASGTTRLAMRTGALVVPYQRLRAGDRVRFVTGPALDPQRFDGVGALQQALADIHSAWIAEDPAVLTPTAGLQLQFGIKRPPRQQTSSTA